MNTGREGDLSVDVEALEDRDVDALIFATVMTRPVHIAKQWSDRGAVVLLNCFDERRALPAVLPDDRTGGATAAQLAAKNGHLRIVRVGGERDTSPATGRLAGYRDALKARDIKFDPTLVRFGNWQADSGYEETRKVSSCSDTCGNGGDLRQ